MKFEAIVFDFDGVIVDSEMVSNAALAQVLTARGYPTTTRQALESYSGLRWSDCYVRISAEIGLDIGCEALRQLVHEETERRIAEVLAIGGLEPFLATQTHRRLAIASSSDQAWLDASLQRLGLAHYFGRHVFSAAGFARGKPHPDIYLHAAERLGVAPSACLVIEDHPLGVGAGWSAGMTVIALLAASHIGEGHRGRVEAAGAHHVAASYGEVADILRKIDPD